MSEKKKAYTRPWFWLLIVLIVSIIIKAAENAERIEQLLSSGDNYNEQEYITAENSEQVQEAEQEIISSEIADEQTEQSSAQVFRFIMNKSSKKYHTEKCSAAAKLSESNRETTDIEADSLEQAKQILEEQGYSPCTKCLGIVKK